MAPRPSDVPSPLRQQIRFVRAADGTRIATASIGRGPPLVRAAHWLSHVEHDLDSPVWRPWLAALSREHRYVRYDQRGCGLSDHDVDDYTLDAWVGDLEAVVDGLGLERFPLLGMSQGGAVAIAYTVRHPERVSHLVLANAYGRGSLRRGSNDDERRESQALIDLARIGWGRDNPAFRQVFTNLFIPGGTPDQHRWWTELQRLTSTPDNAARTLAAFYEVDVSADAERVRVPTLVLHARGDARVPFDEGRRLASAIPGARFVPIDSANHELLDGEPGWPVFMQALREFIGVGAGDGALALDAPDLTPAERAVLLLIAQGLDNQQIAQRLGKREKTVRNQVTAIFDKLGVRTRAEAIVRVRAPGDGPGDAG
jgi:pimeloyl-ACP methyl ester carboxylesterase/DNA-binding CsgD family transcriptional regulator